MATSHVTVLEASQVLTCPGGAGPRRGKAMSDIGLIDDGAVAIADGRVAAAGTRDELRARFPDAPREDLRGHVLTPGLVDSHTHAVFGRYRLDEYEMRCAGVPYMEIARQGGGINASVRDLREREEDELVELSRPRLRMLLEHGVTTVEIKSGYGLTLDDELKMLRVIQRLGAEGPIDVVPTFLGAHSVPPEYRDRRDEYVSLVADTMIPAVADSGLAVFCDVFLEPGVFTPDETRQVLHAAVEHGLCPRIHADEFESSGGAELAVEYDAASADHLGAISDAGISAIAGSDTLATLLPGTLFFLGKHNFPPARRLIDAGAAVALASDFNPGSSPTVNLQLIMSIACSRLGLSPAEALVACTANGAAALRLRDGQGTLEAEAPADIVAFRGTDYRIIPYLYGVNHCVAVWKNGRRVH
ncbi:MAG: imidazolonepropionase [Gemmatimonadetes bacterium]|uniref:Imidazolonepropionase n=1 Tax=Candidatus Kutchimonas denitrificans TaxID=3056748 RepID=A0AAE4Z720_9BACT|nr:imidazolonepropionase [Gemmatimonadota bacterium]NIR73917.1 imidazolonepropionase [Candidatus Kutchimonas denitrificans]NIR99723.1 imidazolonepropionase [Gemmatimonadota bacterium]NIT65308.1 imidazolonepropionase [Gemmatimonadota bacterium]NIW73757.1 imidazolonepropionase [Gemmatimonadota bacterium]